MAGSLPPHIQAMLSPEAYPHPVDGVELRQTHISYLLFAGDFVYKVKKPLDLGFLNFTTLELRRHFCEEEVRLTKQALGWPEEPPFYVPDEALAEFRKALDRGRAWQEEWNAAFAEYERAYPEEARLWRTVMAGELPAGWDAALPTFSSADGAIATRVASGKVLNAAIQGLPTLVGGSADLAPSTNTYLKGYGDLGFDEWCGHNMHFGVREHAMGNIVNGLALHGGVIPYGATFLLFSDYCRPSIRLSALMGQRVIYVMTHDSIGLGEDGPTHQPIEHLAALRAIPNLAVFRPADLVETAECWELALERRAGPSVLALTRQGLPALRRDCAENLSAHGAYILAPAESERQVTLIASGSEVSIALEARGLLADQGISAAVVSMPCWELFQAQPAHYRDEVPGPATLRIGIEAGMRQGWDAFLQADGGFVGMTGFGASAPIKDLYPHFGITAEAVVEAVKARL
ncbi:MAG: hypothetical protein IH926_02915 [Proteobacteria bacterium]|nr:hypothetical protein [Pseudomonadota bacterium]